MGELLDFKAKVDFSEAKKDAADFEKFLGKIGVSLPKSFDTKPMSAFQQGVFKLKQELQEKDKIWKEAIITEQKAKAVSAESKATIDALKISEQELNNQLKAKKITTEEYAIAQKKLNDEQRLAAATQKEADRQASQAIKLQKEQLQLERQQEQQTERNRKKLAQQNSEYFKLNQALNAVRGRAKDVLAEMFKLELQGKKNSEAYKQLEARSKGLVAQTQILDKGIKKIDDTLGLHQRHVGDYGRAIEALNPHFASINAALAVFGTSIDKLAGEGGMKSLGVGIAAVGKNILKFLISPVGLVITALASLFALFQSNKGVVIDFDDKLLNVGKTTGLTGRGLVDLGNAVIELSKKLETVSASKLLEYATVAGSLGVTGTKDILAFSEALSKLEIASNIQGEEGAAEIARLLTLTDGGVQNVQQFGDEIVNLGNAFAATEKEILSNAEQISQNTGLYKIGRQEVLAYATATKSVGLEAEVVGSAFARTLATFEKAIRTGKNIDELAKQTGLSVDQLKAKFKDDASGVFNDFIKGLHNVDETGGSVNGVLETLGIIAVRDQRVISTLATSGYDVLARSLDVVKNSSGALTTEFDTASGKLKNQSAKFGIAWDNLVLSVENGQGVIGKSAAGIVGAFTDIVDGLTPSTREMTFNEEAVVKLTARYDELKLKGQLLGGEFKLTKDEQEELRKVTAEIGIIIPSVITQFDKYGNALDINRGKIDQMTKAQRELFALQNKQDIAKANKDFENSIKIQEAYQKRVTKGTTFFIGDADLADFKDKATLMSGEAYKAALAVRNLGGSLSKAQQDIIKHYESIAPVIKKTGNDANRTTHDLEENSARTAEVIKAEIARLTELRKPLDIASEGYKNYTKQIKALKEELRLANGGSVKGESGNKAIVNAQRSLQSEIDDLNNKAKRKQLDNDKEEIANVEAKYQKLREKAIAFNNDPINKKKGLKVDAGGLVVAETAEKDALRDKQAATKLKTSIDEQKKLYDDYEAYKTKVGTEKANERYKALIDTDRTYLEKLEMQRAAITDPQKSKGGSDEDVKASEERLKVLDKEIAAEKLAQQKKQEQLLAEFVSYADERKALTQKYEADLLVIGDNPGAGEKRKAKYDKELKELDFENLKKLDSYETLFKGIEQLSERSALKQVEFARKALDKDILSGAITDPEEIAKIKAFFNDIERTIREGSGKALRELGDAISSVANEVATVNEGFGKMLGVVGSVVSRVGDIKSGLKDFNKDGASGFDKLTAGLGIFGAGVSIFKSIFSLFDRSAQREAQAAYSRDLQNKQTEALNKALERQVALLDDAYGTERIVKYNEAIKAAADNEKKYQDQLAGRFKLTGDQTLNKYITKLNNGENLGGFLNADDFRKQLEKAGAGLPTSITELQTLLDEGKLDASTATIVENLIKANETAQQLANNLKAERVGAGLSTIVDEFVDALESGADGFEDTLTKSIRRGLLNALKGDLTAKYIQDFYNKLDSALADGKITSEEDKALKDLYAAAEKYGKEKLDYINSVAPGSKDGNMSSVAKNITQITSDQASALEGITRGQYGLQKTLVSLGIERNDLLRPIGKNIGELFNIAKANFENTVAIKENTAKTVEELKNAVVELKAINTNTKSGSVRGAGFG